METQTHLTQREKPEIRDMAWELYALTGLRSASRLCDELEALGYPRPARSTVQSWIDRGTPRTGGDPWRDRLSKEMSAAFPHMMREIAGDLMLSGVHSARRLLQASERGEILDRDEREQIRMSIDHAGFAPVGDARGLGEVKNDGRGDSRRSIARYLSAEEFQALVESGGASIAAPSRPNVE